MKTVCLPIRKTMEGRTMTDKQIIAQLKAELAELREHVAPVLELERLAPHEFHGLMLRANQRIGELEDEKNCTC